MNAFRAPIWFALVLCIFFSISPVSPAQAGTLSRVATRLTISPLEPVVVGTRLTVIVHLTDIDGEIIGAVGNEVLYLFVDGVQERRIRTDDSGEATFRIKNELSAGTHKVEVIYKGTSGLLPSSTSAELVIVPAQVEIHTIPPLPGISFSLAGRQFTSDEDGIARIEVDKPGIYTLILIDQQVDRPDLQGSFSRWGDDVFSAVRELVVPTDKIIEAGFEISYQVSQAFIDLEGEPVDPARITSLTFKGSNGATHTLEDNKPRWLLSGRVSRLNNGLHATQILYSLMSVVIDGSNVVSQAQQRFYARPNDVWSIQLLLYSAHFTARDLLFPFPIGTGIRLEYPDAQIREFHFDSNGDVKLESLARGIYKVTVIGAKGVAPPTPIAMSRDQIMEMMVISRLDMALGAILGVSLAFGMLFYGRPELLKRLAALPRMQFPKRRSKRLRRVYAMEVPNLPALRQCPVCQATARQAKAGRNRSGSQRYRCSECGRVYTPAPNPIGFSAELRELALQLYLAGNSQQSIAGMLDTSPKTISKWVRDHRIKLPPVPVREPVEIAAPAEPSVPVAQLNSK